MHRLRKAILNGEPSALSPAPEPDRRSGRRPSAAGDRRGSERFVDETGRALLSVRGKTILARVINASAGGVTVEAALAAVPGETVRIEHPEISGEAVVRWAEGGRIGLELAAG